MTRAEFDAACTARRDAWIPACGGSETPFTTKTGARVLYCFNPATGKHAYIDLGADIEIPAAELAAYGLGA
jgi:hypothetical protein